MYVMWCGGVCVCFCVCVVSSKQVKKPKSFFDQIVMAAHLTLLPTHQLGNAVVDDF